ncbi:Hsp20/alpha crystallin family protein [Candidatus Uhrbacteria bacterium]|nr:Hsp20/alpha crystallin family protein [Candidatus Uhrbacteria bacterium]
MLKFPTLFQKTAIGQPDEAETLAPITPTNTEDDAHSIWSSLADGELLVDMYERSDAIVIRSLVAGARPEDIEISLHNDMLTIKGKREEVEEIFENQFLYRECYWGGFSRTIVLPCHVQADGVQAYFKNGVMMIVLPKGDVQQPIALQDSSEDDADEE